MFSKLYSNYNIETIIYKILYLTINYLHDDYRILTCNFF